MKIRKLGQVHKGAASSAAKMNKRHGQDESILNMRVWCGSEGWVKWTKIEAQVAKAHREWRHRKAMAGVYIADGMERVADEIAMALGKRRAAQ